MAQVRHNCHLMALSGASLPQIPEGLVPASVVTDMTPGPELCTVMLITASRGSHSSDEETQAQEGDDLRKGAVKPGRGAVSWAPALCYSLPLPTRLKESPGH